MVCRLDQTVHARLLQAYLLKKHLPLVVGLKLGYLALYLGCDNQYLRVFVLHCLAHRVDITVACDGTCLVDIADIHDRLAGQKEQVVGNPLLVFCVERDRTSTLPLLQGFFIAHQHLVGLLCLFVATRLRLFLHLGYAALYRLEVFYLQLGIDDLLVAHRVHLAVDMHDVVVVEAT